MAAENKDAAGLSNGNPQQERYPFSAEHLYVITELAHLGMAYLQLVLPQFEKELDGAGKRKRAHYEHLKSLFEVAGPETVRHFGEMCQYLCDKAKGGASGASEGPQKDCK